MVTIAEFQVALDTLQAGVEGVTFDVANLKQDIADLISGGAGLSATDAQAIYDRLSGIATQVAALDATTTLAP